MGEVSEERRLTVLVLRGQVRVMSALTWQRHCDRTYRITLGGPDGPVTASGNDLFEALQQVRLQLEPRGWSIAVHGARNDTYPTGMMRDMNGAQRVYVLRLGRHVHRAHLVFIFHEAAVESLGTVEEQKAYYRDWRLSLKR
ncbi:hypothetical protein LWC34_06155 [Kibdelosporangium philippinense]|uniref:Uncharacterized protein n=1 Tax=Kibdelosporangium philippinense TaxID=211113 RepID=A0ABS8Z3A5_9PSEU|nr:hypothetical protein [Kibdelosporangium philippinense]MCE7002416.1 hypothetical protein [Kibdelosporangium philippinense]